MPWDPLRELLALQERAARLAGAQVSGWMPAVDLYETADAFVVQVELAGLTQEQVAIRAQARRLTIAGSRPDNGIRPQDYHRLERSRGAFSRTFEFESSIDPDGVKAGLIDGVLTIHVPKAAAESDGPRRVTIS